MIYLLMKDAPNLMMKLKHVDIYNHWLRQEVQTGKIEIFWVPTMEMLANGLTKPLSCQKHEAFIRLLGLVEIVLNDLP